MISGTALILVDMQEDYLDRVDLVPSKSELITQASTLLGLFREQNLPIVHARTIVSADGANAMPHWEGQLSCVAGTIGAQPPAELVDRYAEFVAHKTYYDAFADPGLEPWLRAHDVTTVVIAGLYTHACVRETALAAYERGFAVRIAKDAIGSDSPSHAAETRAWLGSRAARFLDLNEIRETLLDGRLQIVETTASDVDTAGERASLAQQAWQDEPLAVRRALLNAWLRDLQNYRHSFVDAIVADVAKPISLATDEVERSLAHITTAANLPDTALTSVDLTTGVTVASRPLGVVGILMPWNNPLALPVGKLAPALISGNAVIFKPAPEGERIARMTLESLRRAGLPEGLVELVTGGPEVGERIVTSRVVAGIAVTGSIRTGRAVASRCVSLGKPIQAELGGNNAAIVLNDVDTRHVAARLVRNAFAYSGQRCTALRRFIVLDSIADEFISYAVEEIHRLKIGDPSDITTEVGPVISRSSAERIMSIIREAEASGNELVAGGTAFEAHGQHFVRPTLFRAEDADARVVQEETFGPVAVIQRARDLEHALELANGVAQGLILSVCTENNDVISYLADRANVGVVSVGPGPVPVHPDAPFGGWKASGIGAPEHGIWDLAFFTRPQARYRQ